MDKTLKSLVQYKLLECFFAVRYSDKLVGYSNLLHLFNSIHSCLKIPLYLSLHLSWEISTFSRFAKYVKRLFFITTIR